MRINGRDKQCLEHCRAQEALFSSLSLTVHKHLCTHTMEERLVEQAGLHPVTVVSSSLILGTLSLALGAEVNLSPSENQVFRFLCVCVHFSGSTPCTPAPLHPSILKGPCTPVQVFPLPRCWAHLKVPSMQLFLACIYPLHLLSTGGQEASHYCFPREGLG